MTTSRFKLGDRVRILTPSLGLPAVLNLRGTIVEIEPDSFSATINIDMNADAKIAMQEFARYAPYSYGEGNDSKRLTTLKMHLNLDKLILLSDLEPKKRISYPPKECGYRLDNIKSNWKDCPWKPYHLR